MISLRVPFFLLIWRLISRPSNSQSSPFMCRWTVCVCAGVSELSAIFHLVPQHPFVYFFHSFVLSQPIPMMAAPVFFLNVLAWWWFSYYSLLYYYCHPPSAPSRTCLSFLSVVLYRVNFFSSSPFISSLIYNHFSFFLPYRVQQFFSPVVEFD